MLSKLRKSNNEGFTIIEVMIVLAIAGLILLIVFLAVPALQRNSRNTQRRSDASHVMGLINEYMTNHNGTPPGGLTVKGTAGYVDMSNENLAIMSKPTSTTDISIASSYSAPATPALDTIYLYASTQCNNGSPAAGGGTRSVVLVYYTEPGTTLQCVGN